MPTNPNSTRTSGVIRARNCRRLTGSDYHAGVALRTGEAYHVGGDTRAMNVTQSKRDGIAVLHLHGEFDSFETEKVRAVFDECLQQGEQSVVLDLSGMTFANSTTLAYFITAHNRAAENGGKVVLAEPSTFILKTMQTLGLHNVISITGTVAEAVDGLVAT